ncbi:MAG: hypothetical protein JSU01_06545 [Bacteroidetes bacterium]|nr:hypothetical protein [Bacteroidota bacterium]
MKKFLILASIVFSCNMPSGKSPKMNLSQTDTDAIETRTEITQMCLDSLYKEVASRDFIQNAILKKTKYLSGNENLKWGNTQIAFKTIPDSLQKALFRVPGPNEKRPYFFTLDSLSYNADKAFARISCISRGYQIDYSLSQINNKWAIDNAVSTDYEKSPGDVIK